MSEIQMIPIAALLPHPDNPRKDVGDISELTESIRKNGIMQNLTVIPTHGVPNEVEQTLYYVLIGNRRLAAAKEALGVSGVDLPCKVVTGLSAAEQLSIMLEENMQREDLTPAEQAQGFQLMLDLGETVDTIAEKSGFSKSTVKHRLELAKLDKDRLEMMTAPDGDFQISLGVLQLLEKIDDVERRNTILCQSNSGADIARYVNSDLRAKAAKENMEKVLDKLSAAGIVEAPEKVKNARWSAGVNEVGRIYLSNAGCENFDMPSQDEGKVYWMKESYSDIVVLLRKHKKEKREKTLEEIRQEEARKKFNETEDIMEDICTERAEFVRSICRGEVKLLDTGMTKEQIMSRLFNFMVNSYTTFSKREAVAHFLQKENEFVVQKEQLAVFDKMDDIQKMVLVIDSKWFERYRRLRFKYMDGQDTSDGKVHREWINILGDLYLFRITDPVKEAVLNGTSDLYTKEESANA